MNALLASPALLRNVLLADAFATGATALLLVFGAGALAPLLGLPSGLLFYAGLPLIPYAAGVYVVARGEPISRPLVWAIIVANALWVVDSVALVVGWFEPTALGLTFVLAQALVVALLAELQFTGLRRAAA